MTHGGSHWKSFKLSAVLVADCGVGSEGDEAFVGRVELDGVLIVDVRETKELAEQESELLFNPVTPIDR